MDDVETAAPFPVSAGALRLVLTTVPPTHAHEIARALVDERLAACVSLVPGLRSIYRWRDAVHDEPETLLLVKTRAERLEALGARLVVLHPNEVPETLVLEPSGTGAAYLAWLLTQSEPAPNP